MNHRLRRSILLVLVLTGALLSAPVRPEEIVAFNVETHKYHCLDCRWAIECTKNCINIPISEAQRRGGVPCKVCGGSCKDGNVRSHRLSLDPGRSGHPSDVEARLAGPG